jgi:outer membrane protein assembly factor BamB
VEKAHLLGQSALEMRDLSVWRMTQSTWRSLFTATKMGEAPLMSRYFGRTRASQGSLACEQFFEFQKQASDAIKYREVTMKSVMLNFRQNNGRYKGVLPALLFAFLPLLSDPLVATEQSGWNSLLNFDLFVANEGGDVIEQWDMNGNGFVGNFVNNIHSPRGIAIGSDRIVYVSSFLDEDIIAFGDDGTFLNQWVLPDGWRPSGLTFGHNGKLFIASQNIASGLGGVIAFDTEKEQFDLFVEEGSGGLANPWGIAIGPDKKYYVASKATDQVLVYKKSGSFHKVFVDSGGEGDLKGPRGLAFGPDGHLYVASSNDDRILRFDGETGEFLDEFACNRVGDTCVDASDSQLPYAYDERLNVPVGITFGADGDLYVSSAGGGPPNGVNGIFQYDGATGSLVDVTVLEQNDAPGFMAQQAPYVYGCILIQGSPPVDWTARANRGLGKSPIDSRGCYSIPAANSGLGGLSITLQ